MKKIIMFLCIVVMCSIPLISVAQQKSDQKEEANTEAQKTEQGAEQKEKVTTEAATPDEQDESLPTREELGNWWEFNALKYDPIYPKWLFHLQGSFSYTKLTGNVEGDFYSSGAELVLRKKRFTYYGDYFRGESTTTEAVGGSTTRIDQQDLLNRIQVDLLKWISYQIIGFNWGRDSNFYVHNRYDVFTGPTFTVFDTEKLLLKVGGYYGYEDTEYDNEKLNSSGLPSAENLESDGVFVDQKFRWLILPTVTLNEYAAYLDIFDDDGSYRWLFNISLSFQILKHFSVFANYNIKEENNPLIDVVETIGAKNQDSRFTIGLSVSY